MLLALPSIKAGHVGSPEVERLAFLALVGVSYRRCGSVWGTGGREFESRRSDQPQWRQQKSESAKFPLA
jgi:hypothetical protein